MFGKTREVLAGLEKRTVAGPLTKVYVDAARAELDAAEVRISELEDALKEVLRLVPMTPRNAADLGGMIMEVAEKVLTHH